MMLQFLKASVTKASFCYQPRRLISAFAKKEYLFFVNKERNRIQTRQFSTRPYTQQEEALNSHNVSFRKYDNFRTISLEHPNEIQTSGENRSQGKPETDLREEQIKLETDTLSLAVEEYQNHGRNMVYVGRSTLLKPVQKYIQFWFEPFSEAIKKEQSAVWEEDKKYGPYLVHLSEQKLAVIVMHEVINSVLKTGNRGAVMLKLAVNIAEAIEAEAKIQKRQKEWNNRFFSELIKRGPPSAQKLVNKAMDALEESEWSPKTKATVGGMLIDKLIQTAKCKDNQRNSFKHLLVPEYSTPGGMKRIGKVQLEEEIYRDMIDIPEAEGERYTMPRHLPMLVKPKPWEGYNKGGYLRLKTKVMRTRGSFQQAEALKMAKPGKVYEALDALGSTPWQINERVLEVAQQAWQSKMEIADLPSQHDLEIPVPPVDGDKEQMEKYSFMKRKLKQRNAELHSLRCDKRLKFKIAEDFKGKTFYFPFNLDFRGRAYPVPPNLNNIGEDFCRGLLKFSEEKPLGTQGMKWLKIHLANLFGINKVCNDERIQFVDENMDKILACAQDPIGDLWWSTASDGPFQALATIFELSNAINSQDPENYMCSLPVHQDGSCNGLQHYAALGLDLVGGTQVNLVSMTEPQDVYTAVLQQVKAKLRRDIDTPLPPNPTAEETALRSMAKMLEESVTRKVVKQTVMTSVYGVTKYGARAQILGQLKDIFTQDGKIVMTKEEENELKNAAKYLAELTMDSIGEIFEQAKLIMDWLAAVAEVVAKEEQPVAWVTPLGLPVVQPYRDFKRDVIHTPLQSLIVRSNDDKEPVHYKRQKSAFPPNFVHSLDSSHMMMTAVEMKRNGFEFSAVHDSYWTHPCDVETMNKILREKFVELYQQPILENLHNSLSKRFPNVEFPPIPQRGSLKLENVLHSKYFFA